MREYQVNKLTNEEFRVSVYTGAGQPTDKQTAARRQFPE